jgi:Mg2+ and Co2+ transporter CorA
MSSFSHHQQKKQMDVSRDTALIGGFFKKYAGQKETDEFLESLIDDVIEPLQDIIDAHSDKLDAHRDKLDAHSDKLKDNNHKLHLLQPKVANLDERLFDFKRDIKRTIDAHFTRSVLLVRRVVALEAHAKKCTCGAEEDFFDASS